MPKKELLIALLEKYFKDLLTEAQVLKLAQAYDLYIDWNRKVNLISRKDIENLALRHFIYSLSIAKIVKFGPACRIADIGTGGGFPGIPLAIAFPDAEFLLVDSVRKKIDVVQDIVQQCGLKNVSISIQRGEDGFPPVDYILGRAVKRLPLFCSWVQPFIRCRPELEFAGGILYLTGEEAEGLGSEEDPLTHPQKVYYLKEYFEDPFFSTKVLVHIPKC